jgi:uncharacterized DUF497 family protein
VLEAQVIWDMEDDPDGNVQHIAQHGLSMEEVEEVLLNPQNDVTVSRSSNNPIIFGDTSGGRYIAVVFEHIDDDPLTLYPITAYDVKRPRR